MENEKHKLILYAIIACVITVIIHELGHYIVILIYQCEFTIDFTFYQFAFITNVTGFDKSQIFWLSFSGFAAQIIFSCIIFIIYKIKQFDMLSELFIIDLLILSNYIITDLIFRYGDLHYILLLL